MKTYNKFKQYRFPREYEDYIKERAKNGPYVLEVKKSGNVIIYEEKTNSIILQKNTADKGTDPYNLYLTNGRMGEI